MHATLAGLGERMKPKLDGKSEKSERIQLVAPRAWIESVEAWRATQRPLPNQSAAIRRLVELGLESEARATGKTSRS